jgi:hypothetical protein
MEKYGYFILGLLLGLWLLRMSRQYGLFNVIDVLIQAFQKYILAIATILLILFSLYLFGK